MCGKSLTAKERARSTDTVGAQFFELGFVVQNRREVEEAAAHAGARVQHDE